MYKEYRLNILFIDELQQILNNVSTVKFLIFVRDEDFKWNEMKSYDEKKVIF